jgi:hypothetical protein
MKERGLGSAAKRSDMRNANEIGNEHRTDK